MGESNGINISRTQKGRPLGAEEATIQKGWGKKRD